VTARKLDDVGANAASNPPRPLRVNQLILGANNGSTTHSGQFGQRERRGERESALRARTFESDRDGLFIAVGPKQFSGTVEIDPLEQRSPRPEPYPRVPRRGLHPVGARASMATRLYASVPPVSPASTPQSMESPDSRAMNSVRLCSIDVSKSSSVLPRLCVRSTQHS
jgi:hypothetical protein